MNEIYEVLGKPSILDFLVKNKSVEGTSSKGLFLIVFNTGLQFLFFQVLMLVTGKAIPPYMFLVNMSVGMSSVFLCRKGHRLAAKNLLLYAVAAMVCFYTLRFGLYSGTLVYFVPLAVTALLVFRSKQRSYLLTYLTVLVAMMALLVAHDAYYGKSVFHPHLFLLGVSVHVTGLILWMVHKSKGSYEHIEKQLKHSLEHKETIEQLLIQHEQELEQKVYQLSTLNEEIQKADRKLRHSEMSLKVLVDNLDESVCSVDKHFKLTAMNNKFAEDFRSAFAVDLKIGASVLPDEMPKELAYKWKELYERAFEGEWVKEVVKLPNETNYELNFHPITDHEKVLGVTLQAKRI